MDGLENEFNNTLGCLFLVGLFSVMWVSRRLSITRLKTGSYSGCTGLRAGRCCTTSLTTTSPEIMHTSLFSYVVMILHTNGTHLLDHVLGYHALVRALFNATPPSCRSYLPKALRHGKDDDRYSGTCTLQYYGTSFYSPFVTVRLGSHYPGPREYLQSLGQDTDVSITYVRFSSLHDQPTPPYRMLPVRPHISSGIVALS